MPANNCMLPHIYVCLMLKEKEGALAVLSLDCHVKESLAVGHGVINGRP